MTEEEMDRLATKIANANGPLANVTPATARERLNNLIRHDREWAHRVTHGEVTANEQFKTLTRMVADHQEATLKQETEAAEAAWTKEQADAAGAAAAKQAEIDNAAANFQGKVNS